MITINRREQEANKLTLYIVSITYTIEPQGVDQFKCMSTSLPDMECLVGQFKSSHEVVGVNWKEEVL